MLLFTGHDRGVIEIAGGSTGGSSRVCHGVHSCRVHLLGFAALHPPPPPLQPSLHDETSSMKQLCGVGTLEIFRRAWRNAGLPVPCGRRCCPPHGARSEVENFMHSLLPAPPHTHCNPRTLPIHVSSRAACQAVMSQQSSCARFSAFSIHMHRTGICLVPIPCIHLGPVITHS